MTRKDTDMDLQQYTQDSLRTESQIEKVTVNSKLLINVLAMFISAGQMLDQIKKHAYYGKEYKPDDINNAYMTVRDALEDMMGAPINGDLQEDSFEIDPRVFHAIVGISTEATELCEAVYDNLLNKKELDIVNILEEMGDIMWYASILMDAANGDWDDVLETNIAKLKKRFPDKFSSDDAINRDVDAEREILEKGL